MWVHKDWGIKKRHWSFCYPIQIREITTYKKSGLSLLQLLIIYHFDQINDSTIHKPNIQFLKSLKAKERREINLLVSSVSSNLGVNNFYPLLSVKILVRRGWPTVLNIWLLKSILICDLDLYSIVSNDTLVNVGPVVLTFQNHGDFKLHTYSATCMYICIMIIYYGYLLFCDVYIWHYCYMSVLLQND